MASRIIHLACCLLILSLAASTLSCSSSQPAPDGAVGAASLPPLTEVTIEEIDGHERLPQGVRPLRYMLDLQIDPASERFSGTVAIEIAVEEPASTIAMHAQDLRIEGGTIVGASGDAGPKPSIAYGEHGGIALVFEEPLAAGTWTVTLAYSGDLGEVPMGLYRVKSGDRWYAFTQFEPLGARRAFPSFDEPRFKTPYEVALRIPASMIAAANAPMTLEGAEDGQADWKVMRAAPTKPLPTYLVAMTVGEFDVVDGGPIGQQGVPFRALVPKGKGALAQLAIDSTPRLLEDLEAYFGVPYPFAKLDVVAVPNFMFGAMENVGLITFREALLLQDASTISPLAERALKGVMAHELAHMWFGNYVTPTWWDDLWLNESFATWMADEVIARAYPELSAPRFAVQNTLRVMSLDSLAQTRAMRQPIEGGGDVMNAFDGITYTKGRAVLKMIERWIGADAFREGVRAYMSARPYGGGDTKELFKALDRASGQPVSAVLESFIDQPGVPLLGVEVVCEGDGASLRVDQKRYLPAQSSAPAEGSWSVPMCARVWLENQDESTTHCALITQATQLVPLDLSSCPVAIHPNADEAGYYHWRVDQASLDALTGDRLAALSEAERAALLSHLQALNKAHLIAPEVYLRAGIKAARSEDDTLLSEAIDVLEGMRPIARDLEMEPQLAALTREVLRPHLDRLTLEDVKGEPPARSALRSEVISMLAEQGQSDYVIANAKGLLPAFLENPESFPSTRASWALPIAARDADALLWEALLAIAMDDPSPSARSHAMSALGSVRDPALLRRTLDLFLTDRVRSGEFWSLVGPSLSVPALFGQVTWPWFTEHFDAIATKLGPEGTDRLAYMTGGFCSSEGAAKASEFFDEARRARGAGMARPLGQVLERVTQCGARRAYLKPATETILEEVAPRAPGKKR